MLEDRTSGTNHARSLLRKRAGKYCVVLKTPAVAQLVVIATNDHGLPLKFQSSDQAPPGLPRHDITYLFNLVLLEYEAGECREITYAGKARTAKPTDCRRLL